MATACIEKKEISPIPSPLPLSSIPLHSYSTSLHSTPLHSTPLHSAPLHSTPLHSTPLRSTPLRSTPLHSTPLHSTPLRSTIDPLLAQPRFELEPPALEVVFLPLRYRTVDAGGNSNLYTSTCLYLNSRCEATSKVVR